MRNSENNTLNVHRGFDVLVMLISAVAVIAVYGQVTGFSFIRFDDDRYILLNPYLRQGISWDGLLWILRADLFFDSPHLDYFQPLTTLSHMATISFFGMNPGIHHMVNAILHLLNGWLVYLFLARQTGSRWNSAAAAAIFLLHPSRVESVAWVTERKDLLSAFFGLISMTLYCVNARRPDRRIRAAVYISAAAAMLSKPMMITLPVVFLLLDFWPLRRHRNHEISGAWIRFVREKIGFLLLSASTVFVATIYQKTGIDPLSPLSSLIRIVLLYTTHLKKSFSVFGLSLHDDLIPMPPDLLLFAGSLITMTLITGAVLVASKRTIAPLMGWVFFLVTLLPVVGTDRPADRFLYFPLIGLIVTFVWTSSEAIRNYPRLQKPLIGGLSLILILLAYASHRQTAHWKDSFSLFQNAVEINPDSDQMQAVYANELVLRSRLEEARRHYTMALKLAPRSPSHLANMGIISIKMGDTIAGERHLTELLNSMPGHVHALWGLGLSRQSAGRYAEASVYFGRSLAKAPQFAPAHMGLAECFFQLGQYDSAAFHFAEMAGINAFALVNGQEVPDKIIDDSLLAAGRMIDIVSRETKSAFAGREALRLLNHLPSGAKLSSARKPLEDIARER